MRYSDLFESDGQIRIDAALFRVDEDDRKFVSFVRAETEDKDETKMWAVCGLRREAGAALVVGLRPKDKKIQAHVVRTQTKGRPGWRMEKVTSMPDILDYIKGSGYGMLARHLVDIGATLLDESINTGLIGETAMRYTDIMESSTLLEYGNEWIILPATMALYGKKVVDIVTAASTWDEETILVCEKQEDNGRVRLAFVGTSGGPESYVPKIGQSFHAKHDQTRQSKGMYKLVNVVHVAKGEITFKANEIGIGKKASFAVFK